MAGSEFGGDPNRKTGVQPPPHVPTPSERLSLFYRSGDESGQTDPDNGEVFHGERTTATQTKVRQAEGVLDKGQEWERLRQLADPELEALKPEGEQ